jgi:DNA-binding CsgD family transcriptional regulator
VHDPERSLSALYGRRAEEQAIDGVLTRARDGRSGALVIRGEAGIGKTALLEYAAAAAAPDMAVMRGGGVESEAELPFAGLHLILRPVLHRIGDLPPTQAAALRGALALPGSEGGRAAADRFLVGLGVLTLLSELAEDRPLLCLIDDAHWLDHASADALFFAARRLDAEGIAMLFAARDGHILAAQGLAALWLGGLDDKAATELLTVHAGVLAPGVRDRVMQEAAGNPLALIELPAMLSAGQMERARDFAAEAARFGTDSRVLARAARIRAVLEFDQGSPRAANAILVAAAGSIAAEEPTAAASLLVEAVRNAHFAGDPATAQEAVAQLMAMSLPEGRPPPFIGALAGLADLLAANPARGVPRIRDWLAAPPPAAAGTVGRFLGAAMALWAGDDVAAHERITSVITDCREQGAIGLLPMALHGLSITQIQRGRLRDAADSAAEGLRLAEDTGQWARLWHLRGILSWLAAVAGDADRCRGLAEDSVGPAVKHGVTVAAAWGNWALALLDLVTGAASAALNRLESAADAGTYHPQVATMYAPDLVEAAVRAGQPDRAQDPAAGFGEWAAATGQPWAAAVAARCRALLSADGSAEQHFAEAVSFHALGGRPLEHARTRLVYGEWLRRERRRVDARLQLEVALTIFSEAGAGPWAERARTELRATGVPAVAAAGGKGLASRLTAQELQVVRLAALGRTNREIAAQLFLSPRTVGFHLYKAFPKLGIGSRAELNRLDLGEVS